MFSIGNLTESVGTDIIAVCPPRETDIPVLLRFSATAGSQDQKLFVCSTVGIVENTRMIPAGGTTTTLTSPTSNNGDFAADDQFLAVNKSGGYELLEIQSISGNDVTWKSGPSEQILVRSPIYAFYKNSDYVAFPTIPPTPGNNITSPYYEIPANTTVSLTVHQPAGRDPQLSGSSDAFDSEGCPMMLLMTNNVSQGSIDFAEFDWVDRTQSVAKREGIASEGAEGGTGPIVIPKP